MIGMTQTQFILILFTFIHVTSVVVWIGSHFYQLFVLDPSLKRIASSVEVSLLSSLFPKMNQVTGLAAILTLSSGTGLAILKTQGSLFPIIASVWGLLLLLGLILVLIILLVHIKPHQIKILTYVSIFSLLGSLFLALERTQGELSVFVKTSWGVAIMVGAVFGLAIFILGFVIGQTRVLIAIQCQKILSKGNIKGNDVELLTFRKLRRKLNLLTIPENILTIIVLIAMISARYLPA